MKLELMYLFSLKVERHQLSQYFPFCRALDAFHRVIRVLDQNLPVFEVRALFLIYNSSHFNSERDLNDTCK